MNNDAEEDSDQEQSDAKQGEDAEEEEEERMPGESSDPEEDDDPEEGSDAEEKGEDGSQDGNTEGGEDQEDVDISPEEFKKRVEKKVAGLLESGMFMRNGMDSQVCQINSFIQNELMWFQGHTNNLSHPALAAVCKSMLYGKGKLASLFPDFNKEVPERAVALAATVVSATVHL